MIFRCLSGIVMALLTCSGLWAGNRGLKVAGIFTDNMVLQQHSQVPVWGWALPGDSVKVVFCGGVYDSIVSSDGKWSVVIPSGKAGGPYDLSVTDGRDTVSFTNVMLGEVWLASGQSNMNFKVASVKDAEKEIADSDFPDIREFRTPDVVSRTPLDDVSGGKWTVCSDSTVGAFSAVAYFFARALHLDRNVPVGIIHSSWSGTKCESWISADMLYAIPEYRDIVEKEVYGSGEDWEAIQKEAQEKSRKREDIFYAKGPGIESGVHTDDYNDDKWRVAKYPIYMSRIGHPGYKLVWLRKEFDLAGDISGKEFFLDLGKVMTGDITYFNGHEVGSKRWDGNRLYRIPGEYVRKGHNVIAVKLLSEWGNGRLGDESCTPCFYSDDKRINIPLSGEWKYNGGIEPELPVGNGSTNKPSCMFNAKISPILPYALKGILWYQGEGNSGQPEMYRKLQPLLIADWRIRFRQGNLPFLFVQLPNHKVGKWPEFRAAQAESLFLPETAMAVTLDVGDPNDVHPYNKRPVGERLYLRAKETVYGDKDGVSQGPCAISCTGDGGKVRIDFTYKGSGLVSIDGKPVRAFEIAGDDGKYHPAECMICNDYLEVWSESVDNPVSVRYAWKPDPMVNLFNAEGLPALPFEMDVKYQ